MNRTAYLVARREVLQRVRSKAYLISTVVLLAIAIGGILLATYAREDRPTRLRFMVIEPPPIGVDADFAAFSSAMVDTAKRLDIEARVVPKVDLDSAKEALSEGQLDLVIAGDTVYWHKVVPETEAALVSAASQTYAIGEPGQPRP